MRKAWLILLPLALLAACQRETAETTVHGTLLNGPRRPQSAGAPCGPHPLIRGFQVDFPPKLLRMSARRCGIS